MTGPDDQIPADVPGFDDPAYDALRGLLADARVTEPVPAEVAARLDAALAGLSEPAGASDAGAEVVPLRRRTVRTLLVAASVVGVLAVGGVGLGQVLGDHTGNNAPTSSSAVAGGTDSGAGTMGSAGAESSGGAPTAGTKAQPQPEAPAAGAATLPALTTVGFSHQAARFVATLTPTADLAADAPGFARLRSLGCAASPVAGGASYPILLDGQPAVLVVRGAEGDRIAEARSCSGAVLARAALR